jgi:hypothetical protein
LADREVPRVDVGGVGTGGLNPETLMKYLWTITCPECGGTLEVDNRTGNVLRHWAKGSSAPETADLMGKLQQTAERARADADVSSLISKVEEKKKRVEEKFGDAVKRAKEALDRGERPEHPLDLD